MPELPEIETIRRGLERELVGRRVTAFEVLDSRLLAPPVAARWHRDLRGQRWQQFIRHGKYLGVVLSEGSRLVFHMRMTGQLILGETPEKLRCRFHFDDGRQLSLVDPRRFAECWLLQEGSDWPSAQSLGPDALTELTEDTFVAALRGRRRPVQSILLDQSVLAGVGNIYAQEALFEAGIRPTRKAHKLTIPEAKTLFRRIQSILVKAIDTGGSTSRNYRNAYGEMGSAQTWHAVYQKEGAPCRNCTTSLQRVSIGGRGVVYCRSCQR